MKLYIYDHCPYCVRARMIFGLKNIDVEQVPVLNDDEITPVSLIGKKAVPILIKNDGTAMPESLDIVRYIDENFGEKLLADEVRTEIEAWLKTVAAYNNHLVLPRFVKLGLPEYATQSAIDYFVTKKTESVGDFEQNLQNTAQYLTRLHQDLAQLEPLILGDFVAGKPTLEDILLFPILRNFTCIKGVKFPAKVEQYVAKMAELSKINLYYTEAL